MIRAAFMVDARLIGIVGDMAIVVLSPHLDDAVLSCWHVLTKPGQLTVINVFTGVPAGLSAPAWWDQYTGATESAERVRERIEEDRRALALVGVPLTAPTVQTPLDVMVGITLALVVAVTVKLVL